MTFKHITTNLVAFALVGCVGIGLAACAQVNVPSPRNVEIPNPVKAEKRREAVNELPDSVVYLPLGEDVLVPERMVGQDLPGEQVGPFELRGETLAGALQLILADYDISIAFETQRGMTQQVTVANLKGPLNKVVDRVCSLADLYCSYEDGTIVVKDTQTFTVTMPPLGDVETGSDYINDVITGLTAVIGGAGSTPVSDPSTRTVIYSATQRTSQLASNYFQRLRASTAMIVFETYIWEVSLDSSNSTGVKWDRFGEIGKFNASFDITGGVGGGLNPVSIGLPTTQSGATPTNLIEFLSQFGAVKSISQPQITVLSGSAAELRVADTENYVSEVTQTINGDNTATSVTTASVDSGFTLGIASSWDKSTVYANIEINLSNVDDIEDFTFDTSGGGSTIIQLPKTTERELKTQIRVRPGDSVLIAGLVRERDNFDERGPGFMKPIFPDTRTAEVDNLELVIMLRPRVIVYTSPSDANYRGASQNRAQNVLSSLQKRTPVYQEPIVAQPIPRRSSYDTFNIAEEEPLDVVLKAAQPATPIQPVYQAPAVLAQPIPRASESVVPMPSNFDAPVAVAPVIQQRTPSRYSSVPSYSDSGYRSTGGLTRNQDLYAPRAASVATAYSGGYVSDLSVLRPDTPVALMPSETSLSAPVYAASPSPLSPNVYNQAKKIDVYDVYNGG